MALGSTGPVETKVTVAGVSAAASTLICWTINHYILPDGALPEALNGAITIILVGLLTFASSFYTRHTMRTDPDAYDDEPGKHAAREDVGLDILEPRDGDPVS